jgi:tetraacyldisaccharide 4'-kinase
MKTFLFKKFFVVVAEFRKNLMRKWRHIFINFLNILWYQKTPLRWFLWPASLVYQLISWIRRKYLQIYRERQFDVPIIVVGNISVGGVGKTPLVIALANELLRQGLRVGIVSRGYGSLIESYPYEVLSSDDAELVGDEPLMLTLRTKCPVVIAPKRVSAVEYLLDKHQIQVIISDDGLQHYEMGRTLEIAVVDGTRVFGNGLCLPAGPLRESPRRLKRVDFIVANGLMTANNSQLNTAYKMNLMPGYLASLSSGKHVAWEDIDTPIAAVAGIGNPDRFFATLHTLGLSFQPYRFADHYSFKQDDFLYLAKNVVMTEKDAVKCREFATDTMYFLSVDAKLSDSFWQAFWGEPKLVESLMQKVEDFVSPIVTRPQPTEIISGCD